MAAGFKIIISAQDGASARIDAMNKKLAELRAPAERLQKSLATFARLSGIKDVAAGFERMARGAFAAFQSIARVVSPLAAITGAASVAGMYRLVEAWGQWGSQLGFTAQRIGITAAQLQAFQGAGLLAGSSTQAVTSGVQALGQTMYDAIGGRAPEAVALFNQLGIAFDDGTRHARSVTQVLPEIADKIAAIKDPYTQARIAVALFGAAGEEMLPFLRRGAAGIADLERQTRKYGYATPQSIAAANQMREAQARLELAVTGLGNAVAERLGPVIAPLLTQMADWIAKNRDWIATGIGEKVGEFATYLQSIDWAGVLKSIEGLATNANAVAQSFGGWKTVLEGIVAIKLAGWALSAIAPFTTVLRLLALVPGSGVTGGMLAAVGIPALGAAAVAVPLAVGLKKGLDYIDPADPAKYGATGGGRGHGNINRADLNKASADRAYAQKQAFDYFRSQGWSSAQAAGLVANIDAESGFNAGAYGDSNTAYGLGQWHANRLANMERFLGHSWRTATRAEQLSFYNYELTHGAEQDAGRRLRLATNARDAGAIVSRYDERPRAADEAAANRGALAEGFMGKFADGSPGATGKVDVGIHVHGHGVQRVTASSSGNVNPPKVMSPAVGVTGASGS